MTSKFLLTALLLATLPATTSYAQATSPVPTTRDVIELGIDAGASFGLDSPHATSISIPGQQMRVGFMFSPRISLEPVFGLNYIRVSGESATTYQALLGVLYHFSTDRRASQLYARPFVGFVGTSGGGQNQTQAALGGGVGIKIPIYTRFSSRFEVNYRHVFASGSSDASNAIGLLAGLSFFTR